MHTVKRPAHGYEIVFRNQHFGDERVLGKRGFNIANVRGEARVAHETLDQIGRFGLPAHRLEVPTDPLPALCRRHTHDTPYLLVRSPSAGMLNSRPTRSPSDDAGKTK